MKRTPLALRTLPAYSRGEELLNTLSHLSGAVAGIAVLVACILKAASNRNPFSLVSGSIYGAAFIAMFTISALYHALRPGLSKKVLQVIDHCTIYFLIAGTYTPILLCAIRPITPVLAWSLLALEWGLAILACVLTAIDLKKYSVFSMICYIGMGWAIIPFWRITLKAVGREGFALLLAGGISYTIGSILYGLGKRKKWMHGVFHLFVIAGALFQFFAVLFYAL